MSVHVSPVNTTASIDNKPGDTEALVSMRGLISGFIITQAIATAAELGVADRLAHAPRTAAELGRELVT
jgi:hypothetical protein